jgi:transcriptional regulator with XRE-family HTH domain
MLKIDTNEIFAYMGRQRMTRKAFAKRLEISENTLRSYFNNPDNMPYEILIKMIKILNISAEDARGIFFSEELTK